MDLVTGLCIDGTAFFVGAGVALAAPLLPRRGKMVVWTKCVATILATAMIALSGTPLPFWFYGLWTLALATWALTQQRFLHPPRAVAIACQVLAAALALAAILWEASWQVTPTVRLAPARTLYVVGDSISADFGWPTEGVWPTLLGRQARVKVVNCAVGGVTVAGALPQAEQVNEPDAFVFIELGGNDLWETPGAEFAASLEKLIQRVQGQGRRLCMMEVPSVPGGNLYGMAQRKLAAKYGIPLVPRRVLIGVWTAPGATTDGIHLTAMGHRMLADRVGRILGVGPGT